MNERQLQAIDCLKEENRVLREQLGERRFGSKAKGLGRKMLQEVATIVTPATLQAWRRNLIAAKYIQAVCALRFFYRNRLNRKFEIDQIPLPLPSF